MKVVDFLILVAQMRRAQREYFTTRSRRALDEAKKAVFAALMAGRRIDLTDAPEFKVSQMHTTICKMWNYGNDRG